MNETSRLIEARRLTKAWEDNALNLADVIYRILQKQDDEKHFLLIVDQFEELYSLCAESPKQHRFLDVLLERGDVIQGTRANHLALPFRIVLTLRADFMGQALAYPPLVEALQNNDVKLGPMLLDELRRAIEQPAFSGGILFEAGLVERILQDVGTDGRNLPLLEFALALLWKKQTVSRLLTHIAYEQIGQVKGALARHAEAVYARLNDARKEQAQRVLIQMVHPGIGAEDTRRLTTRTQLGEDGWLLAQRLADADTRLLVTSRDEAGQETAEVIHEALIQHWDRLRSWTAANRAFRTWQERLRAAVYQWEESSKDSGTLLRGKALAEAEAWLAKREKEVADDEQEYIQASIRLWKKERRTERLRWLSIVVSFATAAVLVAVAASLAVTGQWNRLFYRPLPVDWAMVPEGEFLMGSSELDPTANTHEFPQHFVYLSTFQIMKYEVTNLQYWQCVRAGVCRRPSASRYFDPAYANHPVVYVNWEDAQTFCKWSGGRLSSEAEWEKAARGGLESNLYPWGNEAPDCSQVNYLAGDEGCIGDTNSVGSYAPNDYGLYDMAGNVWEWVLDFYDADYYTVSPSENPTGPGPGSSDERDRVLRGGSWYSDHLNIRSAFRRNQNPDNWSIIIGFRCARSP